MYSFEVEFAHARLRYQDLGGKGVPLLFVHGLGCASSADYPRVANEQVLTGRRMLLVDLLGSGCSDRPREFAYTVEAHAQSLVQLVEGLGFEAVDLFGHSAGGAVAIVTASLCNRVRKLILSEPNLDPGGGLFSRQIAQQTEEAFVTEGHSKMVLQSQTEGNSNWARSLAASSPLAVHRFAVSLVRGSEPTWRAQLLSLSVPRTVIFGEHSLPDPDTVSLAAVGITVRIVPQAGHSLAWDNPSGLATAIRQSLEQ
jgi:pimeloyl-ACP methyl ester carboxylesterase